jgi:hypothetical protein
MRRAVRKEGTDFLYDEYYRLLAKAARAASSTC